MTIQVSADAGADRKIVSIYNLKSGEETVKLWMKLDENSSVEPSLKIKSKELSITASQKLDAKARAPEACNRALDPEPAPLNAHPPPPSIKRPSSGPLH